jgi:hypothetical protein
LKEMIFVGLVLGFSVLIFGLIARAMIVDSREHVRFNVLRPGRRIGMDPSKKMEQREQVVELSNRMSGSRRDEGSSTRGLGRTA